jgi:hypothetical protein
MTVETIVQGFFSNFGFIMLVLGVVIASVRSLGGRPFFQELLRWTLLFGVGINCLYSGIGHIFLPDYSAKLIGWEDSPFQLEVGSADFAIGVAGILSFWGNYGFRLAVAIIAALFYAIDAAGHVHQMIVENNFATGNAGSWFWIDISAPIILMVAALVVGLRKPASTESPTSTT